MPDWKDPRYLLAGTARQQQAYAVLAALALLPTLRPYDPVLVGTIPLAIDLPGSDLDVLCEVAVAEQATFEALVRAHYGQHENFCLYRAEVQGYSTVVCSFRYAGTELELFAQARPTAQQPGYRHLLAEHAVLAAGGPAWQAAVRQLKSQGLKTEPAFAQLLALPGDPYAAMLALADEPLPTLQARLRARPLP